MLHSVSAKSSLLIVFLTICSCSSIAAINRNYTKKDTLKLIQGVWEFRGLVIKKGTYFPESFFATDLHISGNRFQMNLSEAATSGTIEKLNSRITLVFKRKYFLENTGQDDWRDLVIHGYGKGLLSFIMKDVNLGLFSTEVKGRGDVIFHYERKRRKSKLLD